MGIRDRESHTHIQLTRRSTFPFFFHFCGLGGQSHGHRTRAALLRFDWLGSLPLHPVCGRLQPGWAFGGNELVRHWAGSSDEDRLERHMTGRLVAAQPAGQLLSASLMKLWGARLISGASIEGRYRRGRCYGELPLHVAWLCNGYLPVSCIFFCYRSLVPLL